MRSLKFNFRHPVKGILRFLNVKAPHHNRFMKLDIEDGRLIDISIDELPDGKWKATMEWEYDGKDYVYEKEFEIPERPGSEIDYNLNYY